MSATLFTTVVTVGLALLFDFTNGFHDSGVAVATVIASKSLNPTAAVLITAVFNFMPALIGWSGGWRRCVEYIKSNIFKIVVISGVKCDAEPLVGGSRIARATHVTSIISIVVLLPFHRSTHQVRFFSCYARFLLERDRSQESSFHVVHLPLDPGGTNDKLDV